MTQVAELRTKHSPTVWINCPFPIVALGLTEALKAEAQIHVGDEPPVEGDVSSVVYCANGGVDLGSEMERLRSLVPEASILVFGLYGNLALARSALQAGARGFIHAGMKPSQIARALSVASEGEIAVPRELLKDLIVAEAPVDTAILSPRQREILELVCEGLTNGQIAQRLFLSEVTIKQHLRLAYKTLGVRNRTEAARVLRSSA